MSESLYIRREMEQHPELEYINDLRILRRFIQNGSFGYRQSNNVVFETLKTRYPEAYNALGEERRREVLEKYRDSPYIELQRKVYPNNPDKDDYLKALERLRNIMILFKLGYGSREMAMLRVNSKRRYPEAYEAFEKELEDP
ncbi:MAG: hypothetical protein ICV68_17915 [Pyrinomonadaceae bacterium]|nr:hypothetical protein [Pyrinomonadaceae bacterium]